jgi:hypothetical protein
MLTQRRYPFVKIFITETWCQKHSPAFYDQVLAELGGRNMDDIYVIKTLKSGAISESVSQGDTVG